MIFLLCSCTLDHLLVIPIVHLIPCYHQNLGCFINKTHFVPTPPRFTHPPYSPYTNSTTSASPNHYTSYTTSSPSDYGYSTHYHYPQQQTHHIYSQPVATVTNAENNHSYQQTVATDLEELHNDLLEFITNFRK